MSKPRLEWRVGLFVLVALVLLGGLLIEFSKGTTFFLPTNRILMRASNVGGLKPKATVLMAGVQVGIVSDIRLGPFGTNVTITLKIYKDYVIHKDARFMIEQSGFLGDQYVSIVPTRNADGVFADGDTVQAESPLNLQEVARAASGFLQRLDETAGRVNSVITNVTAVLLNEHTLTNLSVAVDNLREVSQSALETVDNINRLVGTNGPAIALTGSNLVVFSERLDQVADGLHDVVATNTASVNAAVKNVEHSTEILNSLMEHVQSGQGLAGNVLMNEQLAASVKQITENLSITSSNLNRLGLWGVMWQKKPRETERRQPRAEPLASPKNPYQ